jgi:hypothetical protein
MDEQLNTSATFNLREQVEALLPNWQSWYPSLFEAACDLGVLRARVCDLSSLVLSNRHASVYNEAVQAFRNQWMADEPEADTAPTPQGKRVATLPRKPRDNPRENRTEVEDFLAGFGDEDYLSDASQDEVTPDDGQNAQDANQPHQPE